MQLAEIHRYPVKSMRGHQVSKAAVEPIGLEGDRRWLVVDGSGRFQTIRELPRMVQIEVEKGEAGIRMMHAQAGACTVVTPDEGADQCEVTIWDGTARAVGAGSEADAFLSGVLGTQVRLVHLANPKARPIDAKYGGEHLSFADDYPLLLASRSSLDDLCTRAGADIAMGRFRPNLVIAGAAPWEEDTWRAIRIGNVRFRVAAACARCVVTTYDPDTGAQSDPHEPLRTLGRFHRSRDGGVIFGQNLIPENAGAVCVGDTVEVLEAGVSNLM